MHAVSSRTLAIILGIILAIVGIILAGTMLVPASSPALTYYVQRAQLLISPSAERAFTYGMSHFNGSFNPVGYNLDRAAYFLDAAITLDPEYPNAHQQLARIHFLQGNFKTALSLINDEIRLAVVPNPSAFYIRGLINGFDNSYESAAQDFERYVQLRPDVWAGYNDLGWTLMKSGQYVKAREALEAGLEKFPDNAWLLNSYAVVLYEVGEVEKAQGVAGRAHVAVSRLTPEDWSRANPGNDPRVASEGLETFRNAALRNLGIIISGETKPSLDLTR